MDDGRFDESLSLYESFLRENAGNADGLYGLANCQHSLGKTANARATLKELLAVSPDHLRALYLQAKVEFAEDKPAEAIKWLRRAERLAPREWTITNMMIPILQRLNQTEEAEKYIKRQEEILKWHGQLTDLRKQLRRDDANANLRFQIGRLNMLLGRDDEAFSWFQMVLRLQPNHAETLKALQELSDRSDKLAPPPEKPGETGRK
jgi:tetratricopeptide (TPR) repeat protein